MRPQSQQKPVEEFPAETVCSAAFAYQFARNVIRSYPAATHAQISLWMRDWYDRNGHEWNDEQRSAVWAAYRSMHARAPQRATA